MMMMMMKGHLSLTLLLLLVLCSQCGAKSLGDDDDNKTQEVKTAVVKCADDTEKRWQQELEKAVSTLKNELEEQRKREQVAFGASLGPRGGYTGPFNGVVTLVYSVVFTNAGEAYNPTTGIFTAPMKGVYYFSFSGYNYSTRDMGLLLWKNAVHMVMAHNHGQSWVSGSRWESGSNSITLVLQKGDQVYMRLRASSWVYDNSNHHSNFNGHLLFPLQTR
ncbi:complement C1q-like protein 2 [Engraulis encrasicolus]|uniref:complement C1q-like protein 2 n=1 Tax=Engraulis encrasicolus TaxID=184585 RepID=UPI002FD3CBBD